MFVALSYSRQRHRGASSPGGVSLPESTSVSWTRLCDSVSGQHTPRFMFAFVCGEEFLPLDRWTRDRVHLSGFYSLL